MVKFRNICGQYGIPVSNFKIKIVKIWMFIMWWLMMETYVVSIILWLLWYRFHPHKYLWWQWSFSFWEVTKIVCFPRLWEARSNIYNPSEICLKLKYRKISSVHIFLNRRIFLTFTYGSDTAVLCGKFQNDSSIKINIIQDRRFPCKTACRRIIYIVIGHWVPLI